MANWASTSYRIEGKEEDLKQIYNLFKEFENKERAVMEEGASEDWEGNIILALGEDIGENYLRGFIQVCELCDGIMKIEAEEAWGTTDFRHLLERHFEDMKVYYIVEEEGCEVFATNDDEGRYFPERFLVNSCIDGDNAWEYFETEKEALSYIAGLLGREFITAGELEAWQKDHEGGDDYIHFHEYKYVA